MALSATEKIKARFDIYGPPHKGLRHAHGEMLDQLARTDFSRPHEGVVDQLRTHLRAVARHVDEENRFIHPQLEERSPHATSRLVTQHDEHDAYFNRLEELMTALEDADAAANENTGRDLYLTFTRLVGMDLGHMEEEEQTTWPLLCAHFSDDEMQAMVDGILKDYPPDLLSYSMAHIAASTSTEELEDTVAGLMSAVSPELFAEVFSHAFEPTLDEQRRARLRERGLLPG